MHLAFALVSSHFSPFCLCVCLAFLFITTGDSMCAVYAKTIDRNWAIPFRVQGYSVPLVLYCFKFNACVCVCGARQRAAQTNGKKNLFSNEYSQNKCAKLWTLNTSNNDRVLPLQWRVWPSRRVSERTYNWRDTIFRSRRILTKIRNFGSQVRVREQESRHNSDGWTKSHLRSLNSLESPLNTRTCNQKPMSLVCRFCVATSVTYFLGSFRSTIDD